MNSAIAKKLTSLPGNKSRKNKELFTLPHLFRSESARIPSCPIGMLGIRVEFTRISFGFICLVLDLACWVWKLRENGIYWFWV